MTITFSTHAIRVESLSHRAAVDHDGDVDSWDELDEAWREAFRQAWEALRNGDIGVGACAATPDGEIVHAARNRVNDFSGPPGEAFGSTVAHAEVNALARVPFRRYRNLILTSTLQPCLQCAAAIRMAKIATVRFAGHDAYWDGYHDFGVLAAREAARTAPRRDGPRGDEIGVFGLLIARVRLGNPRFAEGFDPSLRALGEGPVLDLAYRLEDSGELRGLLEHEVDEAFAALQPRLSPLAASSTRESAGTGDDYRRPGPVA
jgi:tRNA(Arg) A34 adenosine deaminase TadA